MIVADKIRDSVKRRYSPGDLLTCSDIVRCTMEDHNVNPGSILPSDFCSNHRNKDSQSGKYHIFEYLGRNQYRVL